MSNDNALRPDSWSDFIGQNKLKRRLQISINAALDQRRSVPHIFLAAPPGVGKTSLSKLIAQESMTTFSDAVCPVPEKRLDGLLMDIGGTILLDEIHRFNPKQQERLLPVIEDGRIMMDNGDFMEIGRRFTVIGATTEPNKLIKPLRERFAIKPRFETYSNQEMGLIVANMLDRLEVPYTVDQANSLGAASAGTPRQARNLALTARDLGTSNPIDVLDFAEITPEGYTADHIRYLTTLRKVQGKAGIDVMCNLLNEPKDVVIETEILLVKRDLVQYGTSGRELMMRGITFLNNGGYE